jgi:hypothetical protein
VRRVPRIVTAGALAAALAVLALSVSAAGASTRATPCRGSQLTGSFAVVPGSAGAGSISYNLRLRNRSTRACYVSGLAGLRLFDRRGNALPTHVVPARPNQLTAVKVVLAPGGYAAATARFSPDVPGPGEPVGATCERTAYRIRVTPPPGGGTFVARVRPPTPVCEHGSIVLSTLVAGRHGPRHG